MNLGQRYSRVDDRGTESWMCKAICQNDTGKRQQVGGIWTQGGVQTSAPRELHAERLHWLQEVLAAGKRDVLP